MPGPPPEHPHLRLLKGNPGKRPTRTSPEPAFTERRPEPPPQRNAYPKEVWLELAPELHRLNLLTILDVGPFAASCAAAARLRLAEETLEHIGKQGTRVATR